MKKNILFFVCFLLVVVNAYADQTLNGRQPREWSQSTSAPKYASGQDYTNNTTVNTNLALTGNNATGNSGYLVLMAADTNGTVHTYYLWVDASTTTGVLRMASFPNIKTFASFPYGDFRSATGFTAGAKVSSQ